MPKRKSHFASRYVSLFKTLDGNYYLQVTSPDDATYYYAKLTEETARQLSYMENIEIEITNFENIEECEGVLLTSKPQ